MDSARRSPTYARATVVVLVVLFAMFLSTSGVQLGLTTYFRPATWGINGTNFLGLCSLAMPICGVCDWKTATGGSLLFTSTSYLGITDTISRPWFYGGNSSNGGVWPAFINSKKYTSGYYYIVSLSSIRTDFPNVVTAYSAPSQTYFLASITLPNTTAWTLQVKNNQHGIFSGTTSPTVYTFSTTADVCRSIEHVPKRSELLIGCKGRIWRANIGASTPTFTSVPVGAGNYTRLFYYSSYDSVFAGSSIGLGLRLDAETLSILKIMFVPFGPTRAAILTIFLDEDASKAYPRTPTVFWGTDLGIIVKTDADSLKIYSVGNSSSLTNGTTATLAALRIDTHPTQAKNLLVAMPLLTNTSDLPTSNSLVSYSQYATLNKTNCAEYTCDQCTLDPYCGWCYAMAMCTDQSTCTAREGTFDTTGLCPVFVSMTPSSANIYGGTKVTVQGSYFDVSNAEQYRCRWMAGLSALSNEPTSVTSTSITCITPDVSPSAGYGSLTIGFGSIIWLPSQAFSFYDCGALTSCSDCVASLSQLTECGWCVSSATCTALSKCSVSNYVNVSNAFGTQCPAFSAPLTTPTAASVRGGTVSVQLTQFPTTLATAPVVYKCSFGSFGSTAATGSSATVDGQFYTSFDCPLPAISASANLQTQLQEIQIQAVVTTTSTTTTTITQGTGALVDIYNCSGLLRCDQCKSASYSQCNWCDSGIPACFYSADGGCASPADTCPTISLLQPNSSQTWRAANLPIAVHGEGFATIGITCMFFRGSTTYQTTVTSATATKIDCPTPAGFTSPGQWSVSLASGSKPLMEPVPFLIYTCDLATSCTGCALPSLQPDCTWCSEHSALPGLRCTNSSSSCTSPISSDSMCPALNVVTPSTLIVSQQSPIQLNGTNLGFASALDVAHLRCGITQAIGSAPLNTSLVNWISSDTVTCDPILSNVLGDLQVYLFQSDNSVRYTEGFSMFVANCSTITDCQDCVSSGCVLCGGTCSGTCDPLLSQSECPTVGSVYPEWSDLVGNNIVTINATGLLSTGTKKKRSLQTIDSLDSSNSLEYVEQAAAATSSVVYTCMWGARPTPASFVYPDTLTCPTPIMAGSVKVPLTILLNDVPYFTAVDNFEFYTCPTTVTDGCAALCTSSPHCGYCASGANAGACSSDTACGVSSGNMWQPTCTTAALNFVASPPAGGQDLIVDLSAPLLSNIDPSKLTCRFGTNDVLVATVSADFDQLTCPVPRSPSPKGDVALPFSVFYASKRLTVASTFFYTDCASHKKCTSCTAAQNCGWCEGKCTTSATCPKGWSKTKCPVDAVALGVGLGIGLFFLLLVVLALVFLIRRARRGKDGLVIRLREPDYDAIAWGTDIDLRYRVPEDKFKILNTTLARRDHLLQLAMALNCPATEQDSLAKGLVFVACTHGLATQMIQTVIRAEVTACLEENTLFRSNSVASKMYKFYSRIVGIKYLYHCIARVILELEVLGKQHIEHSDPENQKKLAKKQKKDGTANDVSLLSVTMELNVDDAIVDDVDTDTNLLQLQLICQKILNVLIKKTLNNIPKELRQIFVEIDRSVTSKFPGSMEAVYKGLGGLFFLRFVCPAITAPHVYGLLPEPPNEVTQRQLVLITKVIQSIANMQSPGKKEEYMEVMTSFIATSIPRIQQFYDNLREAANINTQSDVYEREINVPEEVLLNGLAITQTILISEKDKLKAWADKSHLDAQAQAELHTIVDECVAANPSAPKKVKTGAAAGGKE